MRLPLILAFAIVALLTTPALAQPGRSAPGQSSPFAAPALAVDQYPAQTTTTKYGWHVVAADAASFALLATMSDSDSGVATMASLGLVFGGPIVHLAHGNAKSAGYSLLARTSLPIGGFLLGAATCDDDDSWDCLGNMLVGGMVGYGSALAIDWFYLARKTEVTRPATGWASLQPSLQLAPNSANAGVAFKF